MKAIKHTISTHIKMDKHGKICDIIEDRKEGDEYEDKTYLV